MCRSFLRLRDESARPFCRGVIVRDLARRHSNWRSTADLDGFLRRHRVPGIAGIDTRRLTRHLRDFGAIPGAFAFVGDGGVSETALKAAALAEPGTDGVDLVAEVTCTRPYSVGDGPLRIVAYDYGMKRSILRQLGEFATVDVMPAWVPASEILAHRPDGVFLSNGPGDPAATGKYAVPVIRDVIKSGTPTFGICLGHQMLGLAVGAKTKKMHQGHHGANHPVKDETTGKVEITSMNHGFAVDETTLPKGATQTHISLFDGSNCGIQLDGKPVFSVQYHPEASPGPRDSHYLFQRFADLMRQKKTA